MTNDQYDNLALLITNMAQNLVRLEQRASGLVTRIESVETGMYSLDTCCSELRQTVQEGLAGIAEAFDEMNDRMSCVDDR